MAKKSDEDVFARRRSAASIVLLEADRLADETAAFDVLVDGAPAGHWSETAGVRAAVAWVGGELVETELCNGEEGKVIAALRRTLPVRLQRSPIPPKYDGAAVAAIVLEVAVEFFPERLTAVRLLRRIGVDTNDKREVDTGIQAISTLEKVGLLAKRPDKRIEPTPAGLHAVEILIRPPRHQSRKPRRRGDTPSGFAKYAAKRRQKPQ